jgi:hypothetical protein
MSHNRLQVQRRVRASDSARGYLGEFKLLVSARDSRHLKQHRNPRRHVAGRPARHAPRRPSRCRVAAAQNRADPVDSRGHRLDDPRRNEYIHRIARSIRGHQSGQIYAHPLVMRICLSIRQHRCASIMMRICPSIKTGNRRQSSKQPGAQPIATRPATECPHQKARTGTRSARGVHNQPVITVPGLGPRLPTAAPGNRPAGQDRTRPSPAAPAAPSRRALSAARWWINQQTLTVGLTQQLGRDVRHTRRGDATGAATPWPPATPSGAEAAADAGAVVAASPSPPMLVGVSCRRCRCWGGRRRRR